MQTSFEIREKLSDIRGAESDSNSKPHDRATDGLPDARMSSATDVLSAVGAPGLFGLVELILKDRPRLERIIHDPSLAMELIPQFLAIALTGFTLFGVTLAIVIGAVGVEIKLTSAVDRLNGSAPALIEFARYGAAAGPGLATRVAAAARLTSAYDLGLIAAAGVCLPSLYFYGLLAGVAMSMARVTVHTLKGMATTAVALVGILPIYMAFALGAAVFDAPGVVVDSVLGVGLILPFAAGLFGVGSLYSGFIALARTLPDECRGQRACLLRRLIVSWSACYTAVTPVMIFTLWEYFGRAG